MLWRWSSYPNGCSRFTIARTWVGAPTYLLRSERAPTVTTTPSEGGSAVSAPTKSLEMRPAPMMPHRIGPERSRCRLLPDDILLAAEMISFTASNFETLTPICVTGQLVSNSEM